MFWFNGLLHWDFGVSSINGQLISEQLKDVFLATMELCILAFGFAPDGGHSSGACWRGFIAINGRINLSAPLALLGFSIPVFWLALLLTLFFSSDDGLAAGFRPL